TITPTTSTINGATTLVLTTGQSAFIVSDGTNYQTWLSGSTFNQLSGNQTLFFRTDGSNTTCVGDTNAAAGGTIHCAFADPQGCLAFAASNYNLAGFTLTCKAGEPTAKTFAPSAPGYSCSAVPSGGGTLVLGGNLNTATVTTPVASPGVVNWTGHGF